MDVRPIRTDEDLDWALREIERLWLAPVGTPDGDRLEVLVVLVEDYEKKHYPLKPLAPHVYLKQRIAAGENSQTQLAQVLGSRSLASDILSGRRRISLDSARKIAAAWKLPISLLVAPWEQNEAAA